MHVCDLCARKMHSTLVLVKYRANFHPKNLSNFEKNLVFAYNDGNFKTKFTNFCACQLHSRPSKPSRSKRYSIECLLLLFFRIRFEYRTRGSENNCKSIEFIIKNIHPRVIVSNGRASDRVLTVHTYISHLLIPIHVVQTHITYTDVMRTWTIFVFFSIRRQSAAITYVYLHYAPSEVNIFIFFETIAYN